MDYENVKRQVTSTRNRPLGCCPLTIETDPDGHVYSPSEKNREELFRAKHQI